jgi:hypothetical protein
MPETKNEWLDTSLADPLPSLEKINDERQEKVDLDPLPAPMPIPDLPAAPIEPQEPVDPIQDKELAKLLEDSAKAMLDASLNIEKSSVSLKKILTKLGPGDASEDDKINAIVGDINDMGSKARDISEVISRYRESVVSE